MQLNFGSLSAANDGFFNVSVYHQFQFTLSNSYMNIIFFSDMLFCEYHYPNCFSCAEAASCLLIFCRTSFSYILVHLPE